MSDIPGPCARLAEICPDAHKRAGQIYLLFPDGVLPATPSPAHRALAPLVEGLAAALAPHRLCDVLLLIERQPDPETLRRSAGASGADVEGLVLRALAHALPAPLDDPEIGRLQIYLNPAEGLFAGHLLGTSPTGTPPIVPHAADAALRKAADAFAGQSADWLAGVRLMTIDVLLASPSGAERLDALIAAGAGCRADDIPEAGAGPQ